jgi:hypothetical protein
MAKLCLGGMMYRLRWGEIFAFYSMVFLHHQEQSIFCHGIVITHVTWHSSSTFIFTMLYRITGSIEFVSLEGPEVILSLTGKFWHRRGKGRQLELIPYLQFITAYSNTIPPSALAYLSCACIPLLYQKPFWGKLPCISMHAYQS